MNSVLRSKGLGLALVALFAAVSLNFVLADSASALNGEWLSRKAIRLDTGNGGGASDPNDYFIDPNPFDGEYTYYRQAVNAEGCTQRDEIRFPNSGFNGLDFFYGDNETMAASGFTYVKWGPIGGSSGGTTGTTGQQVACVENFDYGPHNLAESWRRRITFIQSEDGRYLQHITSPERFERIEDVYTNPSQLTPLTRGLLDYISTPTGKNGSVYIRVGDVSSTKICKDLIVLLPNNTQDERFGVEGKPAHQWSAMLFAVRDDPSGETSESMEILLNMSNPNQRCALYHDFVWATKSNVRYPLIVDAPDMLQAQGFVADGGGPITDSTTGNRYAVRDDTGVCGGPLGLDACEQADDSYIMFWGTEYNIPPDPPAGGAVDGSNNPAAGGTRDLYVCEGDGTVNLGNVICPLVRMFDGAARTFYNDWIVPLLAVPPLTSIPGLLELWRDGILPIANILFFLVFLIVVFSQGTSIGVSNYGIKRMLPRLIAIAIIANISFYLCAFAVDFSNILADGISSLIMAPIASLPSVNINFAGGWTGFLQSAGAISLMTAFVAGQGGIIAAAVAIIMPLLLLIAVTVFLLIIRLILIVGFAALSPIILMGFILPGTQRLAGRATMGFLNLLWASAIIAAMVSISGFVVYIIEKAPIP